MDLLLDTHVLLWWDARSDALAEHARAAIADPGNRVFVSAAAVWEIAIKAAKGKLKVGGSASENVVRNGFLPVPIDNEDAELAGFLAWAHGDPFDRMMVAQARRRGLTLVHADREIAQFLEVAQLWAR